VGEKHEGEAWPHGCKEGDEEGVEVDKGIPKLY